MVELRRVMTDAERVKQARKRLKDFAKQNLDESTKAQSRSKSFRNAAARAAAAAREAAEKAGVIRSTEVNPSMITRLGGFSKKKTRKLRRGSRKKTKNRKIKKRKTKRNY